MSQSTVAVRAEARQQVVAELDAWRARSVPSDAPLDADDLAHLVRGGFDSLGIDADVGAGFSVNTVHYYRRKDILDAPAGRTSSARYGVRHVWQAMGARLAGHLGLVTLAEARKVMRGADEETLKAFVAARVLDARARVTLREPRVEGRALPGVFVGTRDAGRGTRELRPGNRELGTGNRELQGGIRDPGSAGAPRLIQLPGDAWCIVPQSHAAHRSPAAARELVEALAAALEVR